MKHFITMTACMILLMALLSQFVQNQILFLQIAQASQAVELFCQNQKEEDLRETLSRIMDCETTEIVIEKEQGTWLVSAPVKGILAAPAFWGIEEERNHGRYQWKGKVKDG